jgi:ubiquinone biosynthesis protein
VVHGDLHGGNLYAMPDGRTALLDFGITGRLDEHKRLAFLRLLVFGTTSDVLSQLAALRDLGAFPPDTDLEVVVEDLGLGEDLPDPTQMSADALTNELRELTKKLLGYGARAPKELMLFVKNMMFLDGAIGRLAPDLDILAEIQNVHAEIAMRHGARLAEQLGVDPALINEFNMDAVKAGMGVPDVEKLTYREVQERRKIVRERLEEKRKSG